MSAQAVKQTRQRTTESRPGDIGDTSRTPQQARSRAALERLLTAAEEVLVNDGPERFTIARVAEEAGVSVGGVYRRFASKEHLLDAVRRDLLARLEASMTGALNEARPSLRGVIDGFTEALAGTLAKGGRVIPAVLAGGRSTEDPEDALRTMTTLNQRFIAAVSLHRNEIRHHSPDVALDVAFRSLLAAGVHRAAVTQLWPDGLTWTQWARELAAMTTAYLSTDSAAPARRTRGRQP